MFVVVFLGGAGGNHAFHLYELLKMNVISF